MQSSRRPTTRGVRPGRRAGGQSLLRVAGVLVLVVVALFDRHHVVDALAEGDVGSLQGGNSDYQLDRAECLALDPDGNFLYAIDVNDGLKKLAIDGTTTKEHAGVKSSGMVFSPDGDTLYLGGSKYDSSISGYHGLRMMDVASNAPTVTKLTNEGNVPKDGIGTNATIVRPFGVAMSPDGSTLYVSDYSAYLIRVVDVASKNVTTLAGIFDNYESYDDIDKSNIINMGSPLANPGALAVSPDGTTLYATADEFIYVFDLEEKTLPKIIRVSTAAKDNIREISDIVLSPDGNTIYASITEDDVVLKVNLTDALGGTTLVIASDNVNYGRCMGEGGSPGEYTQVDPDSDFSIKFKNVNDANAYFGRITEDSSLKEDSKCRNYNQETSQYEYYTCWVMSCYESVSGRGQSVRYVIKSDADQVPASGWEKVGNYVTGSQTIAIKYEADVLTNSIISDPTGLALSSDGATLYVAEYGWGKSIRTVGTGQLVCGDGQKKNAAGDACEACPNDSVSSGFAPTCTPCTVDGEGPNAAQTACEPCSAGFAGTGGSCQACENGEQPNAGKTACDACPAGFAGTGDSCQQCADGKQPDASKAACEACLDGYGGTGGICEACPSGKTEQNNVCTDCGSNAWSSGGEAACTNCTDGEEPNGDRSGCAACGEGTAGTGGSCDACPEGHGPSADMTTCVVILPDSAGYRPHAKATLLLSLLAGASCVARF